MPFLRSIVCGVVAAGLGACAGGPAGDPPLPTCGSAPAAAPSAATDTLHVVVRVAHPGPVALLVRVDAPGDSDIEFPADAPAGASAAGLAVGTRGVFSVCVSADPAEIGFRTTAVPHARAWLRVTTLRPVRARLEFESGAPGAVVRVGPGASDRSPAVGGEPTVP